MNCSGSCAAIPTCTTCKNTGVRIWNEWADADGDLGHIYGYQWRSWPDYQGGFIDQISEAVENYQNTTQDSPPHHRQCVERSRP